MTLDRQSLFALNLLKKSGAPDITRVSSSEARRAFHETYFRLFSPRNMYTKLAGIENRKVQGPFGDICIRIYRPTEEENLPICLYIHGGGWIRGDLDIYDYTCRALSLLSDHLIVSLDYHLSPEAKFPIASEESYFALNWLKDNAETIGGNGLKLAVAGDSSGGNLAAVAALMSRDRKGPELTFQLLIYPVLNRDFSTKSYAENGEGYFLTKGKMEFFWNQYLSDPSKDEGNPYASPLRALDFHDLPPAHIITAEFDPLRDEGEAYCKKLRQADVQATVKQYDNTIHGFALFSSIIEKGEIALSEAADALRPF